MDTYVLRRDGDKDIRFTGEVLAEVSSSPDTAHPDWSRETGRWAELSLYRTQSGKYVCHRIGRTQWQGEHDRFEASICDTEDQVFDFFGGGWLSKELYNKAGIECIESVD